MTNKHDYVELGLSCAEVCKALDRGLGGKRPSELNQSVLGAIEQLTTWVEPTLGIPIGPLTKVSTPGLWAISRGKPPGRVNEMRFPERYTGRTIKI